MVVIQQQILKQNLGNTVAELLDEPWPELHWLYDDAAPCVDSKDVYPGPGERLMTHTGAKQHAPNQIGPIGH
jgi:hypothetical protein